MGHSVSGLICPLAIPGAEDCEPARCKDEKTEGRPCPFIYYYENFANCSIYQAWVSKLIRLRRLEKPDEYPAGENNGQVSKDGNGSSSP